MKQPHLIQTKLNYSSKPSKYVQLDGRSIDVDTIKVYEIKDQIPPKNVIDSDLINLESYSHEQKLSIPLKSQSNNPQLLRKIMVDEKYAFRKQQQDNLNMLLKSTNKQKLTPFGSFMQKIYKTINGFLLINESNSSLKVTSQQFYNLSQTRKKLLFTNQSSPKDFFSSQYTNNISFLKFLIQQKQKEYEIYQQFQQIEKILTILENQIEELTQIYIFEEEAKTNQIFSEEFTEQIQKLTQVYDSIYKKKKETLTIEEQSNNEKAYEQKNIQSQVEQGQMDLSQLSNRSFSIQPVEIFKRTLLSKDQQKIKEISNQIELEVITVVNKPNFSHQCDKLISSFEERQIFSVNQAQMIVENQSNSQKCPTSSVRMEIEEQI